MSEPIKVTILPTTIWIENGFGGERVVVAQHEGMEPFDYAIFNYRYGYTDNASTHRAAVECAKSIGATEPVEMRSRPLPALASLPSNPEHDTYGAPPVGALTDPMKRLDRPEAEHMYSITAFDYAKAPIGSRDWTLFWNGWQYSRAALAAAPAPASSITIDFKQATELLAMFGDEPTEISLMTGEGHSGPGLYAVYNADPEGSVYLGETDEEATPAPSDAVKGVSTAEPEGWKLVPTTATKAMQDAWDSAPFSDDLDAEFRRGYQLMIAAAPSHPPATPAVAVQAEPDPVRAFLFREYNKDATTPAQIARQREIGALLDSFDRKPK